MQFGWLKIIHKQQIDFNKYTITQSTCIPCTDLAAAHGGRDDFVVHLHDEVLGRRVAVIVRVSTVCFGWRSCSSWGSCICWGRCRSYGSWW